MEVNDQITMKTKMKIFFILSMSLALFIWAVFFLEMKTVTKKYMVKPISKMDSLFNHTVLKTSIIRRQCDLSIDVIIQLVHAMKNSNLQWKLNRFLNSLLSRTKCRLNLYVLVDEYGEEVCERILKKVQVDLGYDTAIVNTIYLDVYAISRSLTFVTKPMQELFSSSVNSYYQNWIFFIPVGLHRVIPLYNITKFIMFDIDLQLREDIQELYKHFNYMKKSQIIGLAREQQPVYVHVLSEYREKHKGTKVGDPPPYGITGFNSGTMLLKLDSIRSSSIYNDYIDNAARLTSLADKYNFRGHLGDQDFYSLLSFEYPELFYTLPCQWNRQLCTWWKEQGFRLSFHLYYYCSPPYYALHGNCDTPIPNE